MNPNTRKWLFISGTIAGTTVATKLVTGKSWKFSILVGAGLAVAGGYWFLSQFKD